MWLDAESLEKVAARKMERPGGLAPSESLGLEPLPSEVSALEAPNAFWRHLKKGLDLDCKDSARGHWHKAKVNRGGASLWSLKCLV